MDEQDKDIVRICEECIEALKPLISRRVNIMDVIPSETIYSNGEVIIPMADVQHIEKKYHNCNLVNGTKKGDLMGILVVMKFTRWNMEHDVWDNAIWIGSEKAEGFIKDWCYFRYEVDGIKAISEATIKGE